MDARWVAGLALGAALVAGCGSGPAPDAEAPVTRQIADEGRRAHIRSFWETFRAAQDAQKAGRADEAIEGYRRALALDPAHEQAHVNLAPLLRASGRVDEARAVLESLVRAHPASSRSHAVAGDLAIGLDPGRPVDPDAARAHYGKTRDSNREESGPFLRLARAELVAGRFAEARRQLEVVLARLDPGSLDAANMTALALARVEPGGLASARPVIERVNAFRANAIKGPKVSGDGDTLRPLSAHELAAHRYAQLAFALNAGAGEDSALAAGGKPVTHAGKLWVPQPGRGLAVLARGADGKLVDQAPALGLDRVANAWTVAFVDLDGDGIEDAYVAGGGWYAEGSDSAWKGQGDGRYAPLALDGLGLAGARSAALAVADLDGDGRADLVLADARPDRAGVTVRLAGGASAAGRSRTLASALRGPVLDVAAERGAVLAASFYGGVRELRVAGEKLAERAAPGLPGPRAGLVALAPVDLAGDGKPALAVGYLTEAPGTAGPGLLLFGRDARDAPYTARPLDLDLRHGVRGLCVMHEPEMLAVLEGGLAPDGVALASVVEKRGAGFALKPLASPRTPRVWSVSRLPGDQGRLLLGGAGPLPKDRGPSSVVACVAENP